MCVAYFIAMASVSIISPFFPTEAQKKGASETVVGLIFSIYPLLGVVLSPLFGIWVPKIGSKFALISGFFVSGGALILFGFLEMMPDGTVFIVFCFLLRCVDAIAGTAMEVSYYMVLINEFPENLATVMGFMETFMGLGLIAGPPIGGALFSVGGFKLPFIVMGTACLATLPLAWFLLPRDEVGSEDEVNTSMVKALKVPAVSLMAFLSVSGGMSFGFLEPTFAPYLKEEFNLSSTFIGLVFLAGSATYTVSAPLIGWIGDKTKQYVLLMAIGFVGMAVGYLLLGPAPFLKVIGLNKGKIWLVCVAIVVVGICDSLLMVPVLPYMIHATKSCGLPGSEKSLSGALSGIYGAAINVGAFAGPTLGGALDEHLHFQWATTILAFILGAQALFLILFTMFWRPKPRPDLVVNAEAGERQPLLKDSSSINRISENA